MLAKFLQKAMPQHNAQHGTTLNDLDLQIVIHYGIPFTASILAFDPIQRLLAIGTLDGRIKIIGGDNIEGLLISPNKVPYKYLKFLDNQGFLVGVSNENEIQVWNLEFRRLAYCFQWEANITAFAVIRGTFLMYFGDENGLLSVLKYDDEVGKLLRLPYHLPANAVTEAAGITFSKPQSIVAILPQPYTFGARVLIAYEDGLLIIWDVFEGQVATLRGCADLQLKGDEDTESSIDVDNALEGNKDDHEQEENEICSLCWASDSGSVLAVGYINGDILFWDMSLDPSRKGQQAGVASKNVAKLQLASGGRRLPVIVLHWSANGKIDNDKGGQLFVYGGDEIGSEEVLTVLSLEWSSGIETLRCISRLDLSLSGSFADMILVPNAASLESNSTAAVFVLTNPGQLTVYDGTMFSKLKSEGEKPTPQAEKFPVVVPTIDPQITVTKFCSLLVGKNPSKGLLKKAYAKRSATSPLSAGTKWPLTGGVPNEVLVSEDYAVERLYIAGYQDGSVKIWDATYPFLILMFDLEGKVPGIEMNGDNASVSALAFCPRSMTLAIGNECGLVLVYKLNESTDGSSFHFVAETKHEVHMMHHGNGFHCLAAFALNSPIRTIQFAKSGNRIAVGLESGQVAMLDMSSLSVTFRTDCAPVTKSPIISINIDIIRPSNVPVNTPKQSNPNSSACPAEVVLILSKDAHLIVIDSIMGDMISSRPLHPKESVAISMYVIEGRSGSSEAAREEQSQDPPHENSVQNEPEKSHTHRSSSHEVEQQCCSDAPYSCEMLWDPLLLLCCEDAVSLYSLKSVIQGNNNYIRKVDLVKHCCWSTAFRKRDEAACGLILLYQTGAIEIRSLPDLELKAESSLMEILRWSFKTNMDKTMSSSDNGHIALVNGCELAFISLKATENDFRIPESLPCLHDTVLAAAADAAINTSTDQKKRQGTAPGILDGIMKGFKGGKAGNNAKITDYRLGHSSTQQLEEFFSNLSTTAADPEDELSIDDIEIDDMPPPASASSHVNKNNRTDEEKREKLFEGSTSDMKPRARTTEEILTKYRFGGDASAAAAHARDKLVQRQEKLERMSQRTAELQGNAENFASLANELVKNMENKKWWKI